jgi:hypothetical protein
VEGPPRTLSRPVSPPVARVLILVAVAVTTPGLVGCTNQTKLGGELNISYPGALQPYIAPLLSSFDQSEVATAHATIQAASAASGGLRSGRNIPDIFLRDAA